MVYRFIFEINQFLGNKNFLSSECCHTCWHSLILFYSTILTLFITVAQASCQKSIWVLQRFDKTFLKRSFSRISFVCSLSIALIYNSSMLELSFRFKLIELMFFFFSLLLKRPRLKNRAYANWINFSFQIYKRLF